MKTRNYTLELTEKEVRGIGSDRWLRKHGWQFVCGIIGCMALMITILVLSPTWEENRLLSVVGGVLAFCSFIVPYVWWERKRAKEGKDYLKEVVS